MSDRRYSTPPTLPEGYQYGDARPRLAFHDDAFKAVWRGEICVICGRDASWSVVDYMWHCFACGARWIQGVGTWRAPHENAAAQLMQRTGDQTI